MTAITDREEKNKICPGMLYLVATPIGNLADLSDRAKKVLAGVDEIAAEDTRNTRKLLTFFGIKTPLFCYFEHNKREAGEIILASLKEGHAWALVTDAGTPAISDPGEDLVRLCAEAGVPVTALPGACACIDALTLSALSTRRFVFEGFLEGKTGEQKARLEEMKEETRTMVFYEAPHRLAATLAMMREVFGGERRLALCRELTKKNEEIMRTTLDAAVLWYRDNTPRGEYVLVVEGANPKDMAASFDDMTVGEHVNVYLSQGMSKMEAIKKAAKDRGLSKGAVYKALLDEENDANGQDPAL